MKEGLVLTAAPTVRLARSAWDFVPPELRSNPWAAEGFGTPPNREWARAGGYVPMTSMGPAAGGRELLIGAWRHTFEVAADKQIEVDPVLWDLAPGAAARVPPTALRAEVA